MSTQAIEVATMLGDSVVDVKHCTDPRSGKITPRTWGVFAAGVTFMLASAVTFYVSVSNAAYNKGALDYWTQVAHKPAHAYRPHMLSNGLDWIAFGGFAIGLAALAIALLRMRDEKKSPYYRIGTAAGVEQPVEGAPAESFPLVAPSGDEFVFNFGAGMTGELTFDGKATPLAELAASGHARPSPTIVNAFELAIPPQGRIRASVGQTQFLVTAVEQPRRHAAPLFAIQSRTAAYFGGSLAGHLALVLLFSQLPVEASSAAIDLASVEITTTKTDGTQKEDKPLEELVENEPGSSSTNASGAAMELAEGAAGTTKSQNVTGHLRIKDNNVEPQLARQRAIEEARNAGILGSSSAFSSATFTSITSMGEISSGPDSADVWGPIYGADGEGHGYFGYGRRGFGPGGGCPGGDCGIIGTAPGYGKIGTGKGGMNGWDGPGGGGPPGRRHVASVPRPIIGQPTSTGDLDRAIIRRYIKQNVDKIGYCYEKQLLAKPDLNGNVMVSFFITPTGAVKSSVGSGLDPTVANCVADVISNIQFPKPNGGGGVQVNYPFKFHSTK